MATRNANNTIDFGSANFGAPINFYTISGGADLSGETNPGEAMEAIIESIQERGQVVAIGVQAAGTFRVAVERSGWTDSTLTAKLQGLGAVVGTGSYDCSALTAVTFDL
jgi:hypothetical protein